MRLVKMKLAYSLGETKLGWQNVTSSYPRVVSYVCIIQLRLARVHSIIEWRSHRRRMRVNVEWG